MKMLELKESCIQRFEPAVSALRKLEEDKRKERIIVAIDGRCAGGKSTLGKYLQQQFDANLFHMDDFFLQKHQRVKERLEEIGGNVDYERFKEEVLLPVMEGKEVQYCVFDCGSFTLGQGVLMQPKRISVIEGSYSQHPYFGDPYDLKIFVDIDRESQLDNIRARNGEQKLPDFIERWIPKEEAYFEKFHIQSRADVILQWRGTVANTEG